MTAFRASENSYKLQGRFPLVLSRFRPAWPARCNTLRAVAIRGFARPCPVAEPQEVVGRLGRQASAGCPGFQETKIATTRCPIYP
jgi:hypothetical protein